MLVTKTRRFFRLLMCLCALTILVDGQTASARAQETFRAGAATTIITPKQPMWMASYCNDVFGYVPSLRVLREGGYEGGGAEETQVVTKPAEFTITEKVVRTADKVPPLGCLDYGGTRLIEYAANDIIRDSSCGEPTVWRDYCRAANCGDNWFEVDWPGDNSLYGTCTTGFLSGANVRIYRVVDKDGNPLPEGGFSLDPTNADHFILVGQTRIIPEGDKEFPDGGWIVGKFGMVYLLDGLQGDNLHCVDNSSTENGKTYWYTVSAQLLNPDPQKAALESDASNEVSASPQQGVDTPPGVLPQSVPGHIRREDLNPMKANTPWTFSPRAIGGVAPLKWSVVDEHGTDMPLPAGLSIEPATGLISGKVTTDPAPFKLGVKVTDAKGHSDTRYYAINSGAPTATQQKPLPPAELKAVAGDGCVMLSWKASPTPGVRYRVMRSNQPPNRRFNRIFLPKDAPKFHKWDYIVMEKNFGVEFDLKYVHPEFRGVYSNFNVPTTVWTHLDWRNVNDDQFIVSAVRYPKPPPAEMPEPGEGCLKVVVKKGEDALFQGLFDTKPGGYWGMIEPGKHYVVDVWLMQDGLANDGTVHFSLGRNFPYPIGQDFKVTGEWKNFVYEFDAPTTIVTRYAFGPALTLTGPGTLWVKHFKLFRCDKPEDKKKPYVPNATVLNELIASQPEKGPKGTHRMFFLNHHATMSSIMSWHTNYMLNVSLGRVEGTMRMTLPMGLTFDFQTGDSPQTRMRPWLTIQHILHSEQDWLNLIEYLSAPYDPKTDTPEKKPWAYKRYQQRGTGTPWTDEFAEIIIEFGNETGHNGSFPDWLGFGKRKAFLTGGKEYGLFTRYLAEVMRSSPYWKTQHLDQKIIFNLGGWYGAAVDKNGTPISYGENSIAVNNYATMLGKANYCGPKWETGDKTAAKFNDHGVQGCLLSYNLTMKDALTQGRDVHDIIVKTRPPYDIVAYEGGPSGWMTGRDPALEEQYGKSLALAVGTLDCWLASHGLGWTYQNFSGFTSRGDKWSSHTSLMADFRPNCGWQALKLRNRYASGDLMDVQETAMPTINYDKNTYPLIGCYAMRDKNRWSVFVLSRKLAGKHDNADFGDGSTPVTLNLPFKKCGKITLHTLAGDPKANNIDALNIDIKSSEVPVKALSGDGKFVVNPDSGGVAGGMPQGSIYLYVFEDAAAGG